MNLNPFQGYCGCFFLYKSITVLHKWFHLSPHQQTPLNSGEKNIGAFSLRSFDLLVSQIQNQKLNHSNIQTKKTFGKSFLIYMVRAMEYKTRCIARLD